MAESSLNARADSGVGRGIMQLSEAPERLYRCGLWKGLELGRQYRGRHPLPVTS